MNSASGRCRVVGLHIASAQPYAGAKETSDWRVENDDAGAYPFLSTAALPSLFL